MTKYSFSVSLCGLSMLALAACSNPAEALSGVSAIPGIDLGGSGRVRSADATTDAAAAVRPVRDGGVETQAVGVANAVDPVRHKITLTHEPIPSIGWPSMTMEFAVAPSVDLGGVQPGSRVDFTMEKGKNGRYEIQSVRPVGSKQ
ncbi:MAG: copper-binding protein [Rhodospirillales bacterium]